MSIPEQPGWLAQRMAQTVAWAAEQARYGGVPFSALVVDADGTVRGRGVNRVRERCDPTAHAEVEAIRDACRHTGSPSLHGKVLLASGEPCALCCLDARFAGIASIYFAAGRDEAAAHGFDYRASYELLATDPARWQSPPLHVVPLAERLEPFRAFHRHVHGC